ncbi:MAG TPA: hypothetical protein VIP08_08790 [Phenylobacterium sp.]|uniref:hypothetical protein n=1 Tax=Phenylobacterium sp. TaxID=1871053 RepID=UPI002F922D36
MKRIITALTCAAFVAGCATKSDKISASYVSPLQYGAYDCDQVQAEMIRVSAKVREVAGAQDKQAKNDQVAMGVGLVLFWPALFFLASGDRKEELSRLKGEYEALESAAIQKKCPVAAQIEAAKAAQAKS